MTGNAHRGGGGKQRREKDAKCKKQVRNGCVTPSQADFSPRAARHGQQHTPCRTNSRPGNTLRSAAQDNLASCPPNKSRQGVLGTSVPGEHSSLWATPPPKVRSHQGAVRRWSGRAGRRHRSEWRVWRWGEHLWCPPQRTHSQRSKHRVRARENDSKPTSPWGLGFPQAGGDPSSYPALT